MADDWYYAKDGQQKGPVAAEFVRQLMFAGQLNAHDLVWRDGMANWQPAREIAEFAAAGAMAAPPVIAPNQPAPGFPPQPGYPQQPGGAQQFHQAGYPLQYQPLPPGSVPNYLVQSILVTIFCCLPLGIVSIVFAAQVNGKLAAGDHAGAVEASKKAKLFAWISFGTGLGLTVIWFLLGVAGSMR